jgi:ABC-type uncharacterized transport system permease subunit
MTGFAATYTLMPFFWLRAALVLYGTGLLYSLLSLARKSERLARVVMPLIWLGATLHLVSLVESARQLDEMVPASLHQAESLLGFLVIVFFLAFWIKYKTLSPGIFVFPLVFLLTLAASAGAQPPEFASPILRKGWIVAHVTLIFLGYAALFLSFVASLLYLLQERSLKSKRLRNTRLRMPALEVIDEMGYRSLLLGFPLMTLGLIAGTWVAEAQFGAVFFRDPKIVLSLLMWAVYMLLLYTRWNAGWRGRKAAFLSTFAFLAAIGAWVANYFSLTHRFLGP